MINFNKENMERYHTTEDKLNNILIERADRFKTMIYDVERIESDAIKSSKCHLVYVFKLLPVEGDPIPFDEVTDLVAYAEKQGSVYARRSYVTITAFIIPDSDKNHLVIGGETTWAYIRFAYGRKTSLDSPYIYKEKFGDIRDIIAAKLTPDDE